MPYDLARDSERIIMYTLFNGLTRNGSGYFASCEVFFRVSKSSSNEQVICALLIKLFSNSLFAIGMTKMILQDKYFISYVKAVISEDLMRSRNTFDIIFVILEFSCN